MLTITAFSFSIGTVLSAAISLKSYLTFKKQNWNKITEAFYQALLCFTFYMGARAIASIFFASQPVVLTSVYILSHIFLGLASAFLAKFATLSFFDSRRASRIFWTVAAFFASDVILNILLPNHPVIDTSLNLIEWGTNKYVGIYNTVLLWVVFLGVSVLFMTKGLAKGCDREVRIRSMIISAGLIFSILVVIPRNIFPSPVLIMVSDIGYTVAFFLIFWAITVKIKKPSKDDFNLTKKNDNTGNL